MFIKLLSKLSGDNNEPAFDYYDANRIVKITDNVNGEGCVFWFMNAEVEMATAYEALSYDAAGLVEVVILARLNPAMCLPPPNVGKDEGDGKTSTGSLHWKANEQQPRKKGRK